MRENDEALEMQQRESLRCFAEDVYNRICSQLDGACAELCDNDGSFYEIKFETVDSISLMLMGSDTNNGDCFEVFVFLDGSAEYIGFSDRAPLEDFKADFISLVCGLSGRQVMIKEVIKSHKSRGIGYYYLSDNSEWVLIKSVTKQKGFGAFLLLWKDSETEKIYDLRFK